MTTDDGSLVQLDDGSLIQDDVLRIVERVSEYDPNLKIQYLPWAGGVDQAPYRLVEKGKDGEWRKVFDIWELDQRVLDRIYAADSHKLDLLKLIDEHNAKAKADKEKAREEEAERDKDIVASIVRSPKDTYTAPVNGEVKKFTSTPR